jgi:anti-anti-sigma factor
MMAVALGARRGPRASAGTLFATGSAHGARTVTCTEVAATVPSRRVQLRRLIALIERPDVPPIPTPSPAERPDASGTTPPTGRIDVELEPAAAPGFAALVVLGGEHDLATSAAVRGALAPITGDVLVDLGPCEFIDSTIIGVLLEKLNAAKAAGTRLELVVPPANEAVARIVDVVGMRALLTVREQIAAAAD